MKNKSDTSTGSVTESEMNNPQFLKLDVGLCMKEKSKHKKVKNIQ